MMTIEALKTLFARDLNKLIDEIQSYSNEDNLWLVNHEIKNSGGNLCLHLNGNLRTYVGDFLGGFKYERDRPFEFAGKDVPREQMLKETEETIKIVLDSLSQLTESDLLKDFPVKIWQEKTNMSYTLIHIHGHLTYHLGQINYHRRLLDKVL